MNKETKLKKEYNLKSTIFSILFLVFLTILLIYFLLNADNMLEILACILLLSLVFFGLIGGITGILKGNVQILNENKYIKNTNPYIYYRDLPNNYGIGVNSLLLDSTIENYKDIVAVILDLCAKKYLNLIKQNDKYIITVLKNIDNNLLSNEKYILTLIMNNDIKNINYQEWYNYCMQDGIDLGLYYPRQIHISNKIPLTRDKVKQRNKTHLMISIVTGLLIFGILLLNGDIFQSIYLGIFSFALIYIVLIVPFYLINVFTGLKNIGKQEKDINYKNIIEANLKKTQKGVEELHKLYSFKSFINDFGNFVDRRIDEVVLWDRYLSYAQVFGLTKEIMKSGYNKLVDNSSFQIDNIENINLYNIETNS